MAGSSFTLSRESQKQFDALIDEMIETTGASLSKVIRNVARDFCKNAIRVTPIAPERNKKGKYIASRGFAKAGWVGALMDLGKTPTSAHHLRGGKKFKEFSESEIDLEPPNPSVTIRNLVPYIEELGPIAEVAIEETRLDMERNLTALSERMRQRWR